MSKQSSLENIIRFEDDLFHDCKIYSFGFNTEKNQLLIDIDYIWEWILRKGSDHYNFIIAPSTLVFENVWNIEMSISMDMELIIDSIERSNPSIPKNIEYLPESSKEYDWKIELMQGEINFKAIGLKMYQRLNKAQNKNQTINMKDRNGISLIENGILYDIK